jgi:hypothetical protein
MTAPAAIAGWGRSGQWKWFLLLCELQKSKIVLVGFWRVTKPVTAGDILGVDEKRASGSWTS